MSDAAQAPELAGNAPVNFHDPSHSSHFGRVAKQNSKKKTIATERNERKS